MRVGKKGVQPGRLRPGRALPNCTARWRAAVWSVTAGGIVHGGGPPGAIHRGCPPRFSTRLHSRAADRPRRAGCPRGFSTPVDNFMHTVGRTRVVFRQGCGCLWTTVDNHLASRRVGADARACAARPHTAEIRGISRGSGGRAVWEARWAQRVGRRRRPPGSPQSCGKDTPVVREMQTPFEHAHRPVGGVSRGWGRGCSQTYSTCAQSSPQLWITFSTAVQSGRPYE